MPVTTVNIPNIGSPPDDPGLILRGILYVPDPLVTPPPWHCINGTQSPGFGPGGNLGGLRIPFTDLANLGFLCLAHFVRSVNPYPTQITSGRWHQQTDDIKRGIQFVRNSFSGLGYSITGFVGTLGGSGSAHHALYCAIDGVTGDDRSDAAICMSPPTDFSDRQSDVTPGVINILERYGDSTDLSTLFARSPVGLSHLSSARPILLYVGDHETGGYMPHSMLTLMDAAAAAAGTQGYTSITNTGAAAIHSFGMWPFIKDFATTWMLARAAEWNPIPPPPPPPEPIPLDLSHPHGPRPVVRRSFITDITPVPPPQQVNPLGYFYLVPAYANHPPVINDIAGLTNPYIQGISWRETWNKLDPNGTGADLSWLDEAINASIANGKHSLIQSIPGQNSPPWVFALPGIQILNVTTGHGTIQSTVPWDPVFQEQWEQLQIVLAAQYDGIVKVIVIGGPGQASESFLVKTPADEAAAEALAIAAGYASLSDGWQAGVKWLIDMYARTWLTTKILLVTGTPFPDGGQEALANMFVYGDATYPNHFGGSAHDLNAMGSHGITLIQPTIPHCIASGFQMANAQSRNDPNKPQRLNTALTLGNQFGAHLIEIFASDCDDTTSAPALIAGFASMPGILI